MSASGQTWADANRRYLMAETSRVRAILENPAAAAAILSGDALDGAANTALEQLRAIFRLSEFERDVVLACAGMELDSGFAAACAAAQDPRRPYPTFSLALAALPGAHWSAIAPAAPLRYWKLIEVGAGQTSTTSPLRIDERILHFLTGTSYLDERLQGVVEPLECTEELPASHQAIAGRAAAVWAQRTTPPVIQFCGRDASERQGVAAQVCNLLGKGLYRVSAAYLPAVLPEAILMARLLEREAALGGAVLLLECEGVEGADPRQSAVRMLVERSRAPLMVSGRERYPGPARPLVTFEIPRPPAGEQHALWQRALGTAAVGLNGHLERLVEQFNLSAAAIRAAAPQVEGDCPGVESLWDACRSQARPRLEDLAQRIEPARRRGTTWCCPPQQGATLRRDRGAGAAAGQGVPDVGVRGQGRTRAGDQRVVCGRQRHGQDAWRRKCWPQSCGWTSTASTSARW